MNKLFAAAVLMAAVVNTAAAQAAGSPATDSPATGGRTYRIKLFPISPPQITHDPQPGATDGDKPPEPAPPSEAAEPPVEVAETERARTHFRWGDAVKQSMLFLSVQHGYAFTQPKTRRALRGPFLKDYFRSVRSLHGWGTADASSPTTSHTRCRARCSGSYRCRTTPKARVGELATLALLAQPLQGARVVGRLEHAVRDRPHQPGVHRQRRPPR